MITFGWLCTCQCLSISLVTYDAFNVFIYVQKKDFKYLSITFYHFKQAYSTCFIVFLALHCCKILVTLFVA